MRSDQVPENEYEKSKEEWLNTRRVRRSDRVLENEYGKSKEERLSTRERVREE